MKISRKLSLLSIGLCALTLILCGALFLLTVYRRSLDSVRDNAQTLLSYVAASYEIAVEEPGERPALVERSRLQFLFRQFETGDARWQLTYGGETLYNDSGLALDRLLDGRDEAYLSVGAKRLYAAKAQAGTCTLYVLSDCSPVFFELQGLTRLFALIGGGAFLLIAVLTPLLTRALLSPLKELERAARRIAGGDYQTPVAVKHNDEIASLGRSFEQMRQSVQAHLLRVTEVAEERKLLLGALTHELKTPLTSIVGYSEALEKLNLSPAQQRESIAFLHRESRRLESLTQKLMRLITLSDGERIDCVPLGGEQLDAIVRPLLQAASEKSGSAADLDLSGFRAAGDADLLCTVLTNLYDNAASAGAKTVRITGSGNRLTVADDGSGIPEAALARVTEPFFRADKARSRTGGHAGLGLALVRQIVQLHRGTLTIETSPGRGTTVTVTVGDRNETESLPDAADFVTARVVS